MVFRLSLRELRCVPSGFKVRRFGILFAILFLANNTHYLFQCIPCCVYVYIIFPSSFFRLNNTFTNLKHSLIQ